MTNPHAEILANVFLLSGQLPCPNCGTDTGLIEKSAIIGIRHRPECPQHDSAVKFSSEQS